MKFLVAFLALTAVALGLPTKTMWTLHDLSAALQDPNTDPAAVPYLEAALNTMMESIMAGENIEAISVTIPSPVIIVPTPTVPSVPTPPAVANPSSPTTSPLVQIIVNVNKPQEANPAPTPEQPIYNPQPVTPEIPDNVIVVDQLPEPVHVVEQPENPIDVIAISPPDVPENPIDVIAISPDDFNPADFMHPVPVIPAL